jgi:PPOX class probable F420-dependent enzyme
VLGDADYVLLTTFRKSGVPVPTPVWVVRNGDELQVWSNPAAGKLKRIRNSGRVELAPCSLRGKPRGRSVEGVARLLTDDEARPMLDLLVKKYGLRGWLTTIQGRYFGRAGAGIAITLAG